MRQTPDIVRVYKDGSGKRTEEKRLVWKSKMGSEKMRMVTPETVL